MNVGEIFTGAREAVDTGSAVQDLDQDDFLNMLLTQMKNQDPLDPADPEDFVAQLATFTMASGIGQLQTQVADLSEQLRSAQSLQAASLIGQRVFFEGNQLYLEEGVPVEGALVPAEPVDNLVVRIKDDSGAVVRQISLGSSEGGREDFAWDGLNDAGEPVAPGRYWIEGEGSRGSESVGIPAVTSGRVSAVAFDSQGILLSIEGLGGLDLGEVLEIKG